MNLSQLTDHQLLIAIAEADAEFGDARPAADLDARSQALNNEGALRWGNSEMSELADLVTRRRLTGNEFVAWARERGQAWLDETR